jgi:hypothetical protein
MVVPGAVREIHWRSAALCDLCLEAVRDGT